MKASVRTALRWLLTLAYGYAGWRHLATPAPFVAITPPWVPEPALPEDAPPAPVRTGSASLGHIKEKRADGREPWDPAPVETVKKRRIAWPGGKISSNKDEALLMYFSKKLARGEALTDAQKTAFAHATKGTRFEGLSEEDAMALAAAEAPAREPEPVEAPPPKKAKKQPKGKGGKGGRGRGRGRGRRGLPRRRRVRHSERAAQACRECRDCTLLNELSGRIAAEVARGIIDV